MAVWRSSAWPGPGLPTGTSTSSKTSGPPVERNWIALATRRYAPRATAIASAAQPVRNINPPNGVMAPSQRVPVIDSRYKLPEKSTVPPMNNQPATRTGDPVQWFEAHATANSASAWYIWYRAPVSKTASRSGVMRARSACAPNAPAATAMNAEIAPASANVLSIDAAAGDLHPLHAFDLSRVADEMRRHPASQTHDHRAQCLTDQPRQL